MTANLFPSGEGKGRSIGQALELAVRGRGHVAKEKTRSAAGAILPIPRMPTPR